MGASIWCFVERGDGSMSRIPTTRLHAFYRGGVVLRPSAVAGEVRAVQVILHVDRRRVVAFGSASFPRYQIDADGFIDREHKDGALRRVAGMLDLTPIEEGVVNLGPHIAKRDYHAEHSWEPTEGQLQELANEINAAAIRPPVVVLTPEGLKPA